MFIRLEFDVLLFIFILFSNSFATLYRGDKCSVQDGSEGKCKLMKECPIAVQLIKTGIFPVICGLEKTKSIMCCKDGDVANITIIMNRVGGRTPGDISKEKYKEYAEYAYEKIPSPTLLLKPHFTKKLVCDIPRNILVVGSSPASRREFPHMHKSTQLPPDKMSIKFDYSSFLFVFILSRGSFAALYTGDKCSLKDGSGGICKVIKECPTAVELIKTGVYPVICGFERSDSIVCCKDEEVKETATANVTSRTPGDVSKQKCKEYSQYAYETIESPTLLLKPHVTKSSECHVRSVNLVVGTTLASRREFPHMALIGYEIYDEVKWNCGGSLISENFVLTAAHCASIPTTRPPKLVRVGLINKTDLTYVQERTISEIIIYPEYRPGDRYHDIALFKLAKNVKFNTYVRPACLQTEKNIPYGNPVATGFGLIDYGREPSDVLLKVVMEFTSAETCNKTYKRIISPTRFQYGIVDDLMICANTKQIRNTCQGDSGGPLQIYHKETDEIKCMYNIIGVISFGKACSLDTRSPGVHARVSYYIKWIEDTVWPN